jgi:hypothetical protein
MPETGHAGKPSRGLELLLSALVFLAAFGVLLQGLWAGIFLEHDGSRAAARHWIEFHDRGADVSIGLGCAAFVVAAVWFRTSTDILLGLALFIVVMFAEAYVGDRIRADGRDMLTAVHVPLAMVAMGIAAWLAIRMWRLVIR